MERLPESFGRLRLFLPEIIHQLEEKIPYVSAIVTEERGIDLRIDTKNEVINERRSNRGIVFSFFNGHFFQEWATDNLDVDFLRQKLYQYETLTDQLPRESPRYVIDPGPEISRHFVTKVELDPDEINLYDMVSTCHELLTRVSVMDKKISNVTVNYSDGKEYKLFVNRNKVLSSAITLCSIDLGVIGQHKGSTQIVSTSSGGVAGFEAIRFSQSQLQELIDDLDLRFESKQLEPGEYEVISSPEVSGYLAHEAFGHAVETDMFVKKRSKATEYMGKRVASEYINLVDDPSYAGLFGSYFFDDEGHIAKPTSIIEHGILKRGLTDLQSATLLGIQRSANGRRAGFDRKVYARMSNTFFEAGTTPFADMLAGIDDGLYLKTASSGMEDPQGWRAQVQVDFIQQIKNGKLTPTVYTPSTITGYTPDILNSISQVGTKIGFIGSGLHCAKGTRENVRISAGGPHLRFRAHIG